MKKLFTIILALCLPLVLSAQEVEMADKLRANGKIYIVVGVVLTVLIGILVYIISIDRKISKIEKEISEKGK